MSEKPIQSDIMLAGSTPTSRLWRNNVGRLQDRYGQWVTYGLAVGSSDLIGITSIVITPEMVGKTVGIFTAIEVKHEKKPTDEQLAFIATIHRLGGLAGVARSVTDYHRIVAAGALRSD